MNLESIQNRIRLHIAPMILPKLNSLHGLSDIDAEIHQTGEASWAYYTTEESKRLLFEYKMLSEDAVSFSFYGGQRLFEDLIEQHLPGITVSYH